MTPKDLDKLIEKYLEGKCTQEEMDLVDSLYASIGKNPPILSADTANEPTSSTGQRILSQLDEHVQRQTGVQVSTGVPFWWKYTGIAASAIILIAAAFFFYRPVNNVQSVAQQTVDSEFTSVDNKTTVPRRVTLPDGSLVQMSPGSKIRFDNSNNTSSREVFLEGEAYFDVAHDASRAFYVYAGNVITKVLGTSFVVRAGIDDGKITVTVKTGKVTVYSRSTAHKKTVITPNHEAIYDQRTDIVVTQNVPVTRLAEERTNVAEMHFEETPVSDVLLALMKTYDVDIVFRVEDLAGCVLTSSFFEEGLYDRIDVICTAIGATYKVVDARITIESKGCSLKPDQR
jgi:transmembrane sensor